MIKFSEKNSPTSKILITGGAGFIGSYISYLLNQKGYRVLVFDNLSCGVKKSVDFAPFVQGDLVIKSDLENLFTSHDISAVIHLAACTCVEESFNLPQKYYLNNVVGTLNLLDVMKKHQVNKIIFSSSAAIFGNPRERKISEDHPCLPINPYGRTKLMAEHILSDYFTAYGISSCSLRYFNAAGADPQSKLQSPFMKKGNVIPIILNCLLSKKTFTIFGNDYDTEDGTCVRDYIHIHDLATAHLCALEKLKQEKGCFFYNLGIGRGFSIYELISCVQEVSQEKLQVKVGPRRKGDPSHLISSSELATKSLGWEAKYKDLKPMIEHAWRLSQPSCIVT